MSESVENVEETKSEVKTSRRKETKTGESATTTSSTVSPTATSRVDIIRPDEATLDIGVEFWNKAQIAIIKALQVNCKERENCPLFKAIRELAETFEKMIARGKRG